MLSIIHETHVEVEKNKRRARAVMYWPQMAEQIEETVRKCPICMRFRKSSPKELLLSHAIPADPWCKVAADVMTYKNKDYLVIVA